ncbi:hypothetical protein HU200_047943 [Digitaria exilis]|uniref:Uncharacterized protein n=1 Tax=Digitaria exilis TaxID=1010633 RepID=A0A835AW85_9POAL|nr:hypothetical protein HU200_047943 [Digitaria exilis]
MSTVHLAPPPVKQRTTYPNRPAATSPPALCTRDGTMAQWDVLADAALASLAARRLLFNTRLIALAPPPAPSETFTGPEPWDRATVEVQIDRSSLQQWLAASQSSCSLEKKVVITDRQAIIV